MADYSTDDPFMFDGRPYLFELEYTDEEMQELCERATRATGGQCRNTASYFGKLVVYLWTL